MTSREIISHLWRQHPQRPYVGTSNLCSSGCGDRTFGTGLCADCLVGELSKIVGKTPAENLRVSMCAFRITEQEVTEIEEAQAE